MSRFADFAKYVRALNWRRVNWLRAMWVCGGVLALIAVLGFLVAPPLVRTLVQEQASKALGRSVSVERVRINPFALSATIEGLRIAEQDGKSDFLLLRRVYANLETSSLVRGALVLGALRIEQPQLHVARLGENRFNFSDIVERFARQPAEPSEPLRFSLNNIELAEGRIVFDDVAAGQKHVVEKLALGLPFVSSIPSQVEILVQPHLNAEVNGTPFALQGKLKPFADRREATLLLQLDGFDLVRYLGYVPVPLPVKISRAALGGRVECVWTEHVRNGQSLSLRGDVVLSDVQLAERDGTALLDLKQLQIGLQDVQPLATPMRIGLRSVTLVEPNLSVRRLADGSLNLQHLTTAQTSSTASSTPAAEKKTVVAPAVTVAEFALRQGRVRWSDEAVTGGFKTSLTPINLRVQGFDLAGVRDAVLKADMQLESSGRLGVQGSFNAGRATADLRLVFDAFMLERYRAYYAQAVGKAKPSAQLGVTTRLLVAPTSAGGVRLTEGTLALRDLVLPAAVPAPRGKPLLTLKALALAGVSVDVDKRTVVLEQIASHDAQLRLVRGAKGQLDLLEMLGAGAEAQSAPAATEIRPGKDVQTPASAAWSIRTGKSDIRDWNISLEDRSGKAPINLTVTQLGLNTEGFSTEAGSTGRFDLNAGVNRQGRIRLGGRVGLSPLAGDLKLDARAVDLLFAQPYVSSVARVLLTQGTLDARGDVGFDLTDAKAAKFSWNGDLAVNNFNSFDQINDTDFVRWKRFALSKVKFRTLPQEFAVSEVRLDDFYSRLILDAQGRFNLREITRLEEAQLKEGTPSPPVLAASAPLTTPSVPAARPVSDKPLNVRVDQVLLSGGNINFSDRFIKPNYDANLTDVAGSLKGLSSDANSLAELALKALVDRSAPVEVSGQLNPLRQDKYLDIKARVTDVDLTGVSPYAARYVGYGINKGKLSMDVNYRIRDRKLTAENKVFLDQLTFGERIDSAEATKLPVLLAVALLKDRNGAIDINLPISGTLDDPEFSVGGIIIRVLVNLVSKAVTSPFALLGAAFGGGEELSYLDFNAGLAALSKPGEEKLTTLARALMDRPALRLEITGNADPVADLAGLKQASLNSRLRALKAEAMVKRGESVGEVDALAIRPEEYSQLLEQVYRTTSFDKPKNAIGMTKSLPVADMEKLILDNTKIGEADLLGLASRRAQVVRDWLVAQGKVPAARIFVLESRASAADKNARSPATRADFSLE